MSACRVRRPSSDRGSATPWIIGAVALVVALAAVVAIVVNGGDDGDTSDVAAVVAAATSVPQSVADEVGLGVTTGVPQAIEGTPLMVDGKPQVFYAGAEYCPFCAGERWAMVVALSRFGTFTDLGLTTSAHEDVFPDTATFTFHGSTYTSDYIAFTPYELFTNQPTGQGGYEPLEALPADLQRRVAVDRSEHVVPVHRLRWCVRGGRRRLRHDHHQRSVGVGDRGGVVRPHEGCVACGGRDGERADGGHLHTHGSAARCGVLVEGGRCGPALSRRRRSRD